MLPGRRRPATSPPSCSAAGSPAPLLLAPVGAAGLVRRDSDLEIARGRRRAGAPLRLLQPGRRSRWRTCAAAMGDAPRWFQLYWSTDERWSTACSGRAEAAAPRRSSSRWTPRCSAGDRRTSTSGSLPFAQGIGIAQYTSDPLFRQSSPSGSRGRRTGRAAGREGHPRRASASLLSMAASTPAACDQPALPARRAPPSRRSSTSTPTRRSPGPHLATLRDRTPLPFLLKGVLHPDDARRAVEAGVDGIVVSNHGGRQVDGADRLARRPARRAGGASAPDPTLLLDSGVRTGADVVKAARPRRRRRGARPPVRLRPGAGRRGRACAEVVANVVAELDLTMGLSGVGSVAELGPELLAAAP